MNEKLIEQYLEAKRKEDEAKAERTKLQTLIADALGRPDEGQKTHTVTGYKVTVEQRINRKVDWTAFDAAMVGSEQPAPVIVKRELDIKGLRWYADHDPDRYYDLSKAITATPGLPGITIKEIKGDK
jgi:hypothetical protein